jgi:DNA helicase-2/ATP-dependent DNA helicase PcrA
LKALTAIISSELNPRQAEAALTTEGPLLILAGAGSGKTRVLTYRAAHILGSQIARADELLAVTFTNKAAKEMEGRILSLLRRFDIPVFDPLWVSTFHSFCVRLLRDTIHLLKYKPYFSIYDSSDQLAMLKKVLVRLNINDKIYPSKGFQSRISHAKMMGWTADDLKRHARSLLDEKSVQVYEAYEQDMRLANALDFDDLLLKTHQLFSYYPDILAMYQQKFKYIMVDEYQDTNHIQYLLVKQLSAGHQNLCVVGDEDQSIYSWRGADISNILNFEKDFERCLTVKLEENYRSTKNIVGAATAMIQGNTERKDKALFTHREPGELIRVREEANEYDEARFVVKSIQKLIESSSYSPQDFAIFYRTNAQSRVLEDQLRTHGLSYRIVGGVKFYERLEIKDILGYLKILLNPQDDIALKRIINTPTRGIGKSTIEKSEHWAQERGLPLLDGIRHCLEEKYFSNAIRKKLASFILLIDDLKNQAADLKLSELYNYILDKTEYIVRLKADGSPEAQARIDNLEELDNAIRQFEKERGDEGTLQNFLEEMALVSDLDQMKDDEESITLMTLHISKGLEFPVVFIVGLEEGLFPSIRSNEGDDANCEEERRLAYVGITRAREILHLTYARSRRVWGNEQYNPPSRFLDEIPKEFTHQDSALARPEFMRKYGTQKPINADFENNDLNSWENSSDPFPNYEEDFYNEDGDLSYQQGMRVRHPTFGVGSIFQVEGRGDTQKISVSFTDRSVKKFVAKYARLEVI